VRNSGQRETRERTWHIYPERTQLTGVADGSGVPRRSFGIQCRRRGGMRESGDWELGVRGCRRRESITYFSSNISSRLSTRLLRMKTLEKMQ